MSIKKFVPWNWFKKEEEEAERAVPVQTQQNNQNSNISNPLLELNRNINSLFDNFFNNLGTVSRSQHEKLLNNNNILRPTLDLSEADGHYLVTVEVPGVEEKDITLELINDTLVIKGEKRKSDEIKKENYYRVERSYGTFKRTLLLPEDADQEHITACFKNGILTVNILRNKVDESKIKKIEINKL